MDALISLIIFAAIVAACGLHYYGAVNLHLRLAAWHLKAARSTKARNEATESALIGQIDREAA